MRCGLNAWRVPGHSRVCRPGLACSDLPGKEGEELRRVVMVLSPGQAEIISPQLNDIQLMVQQVMEHLEKKA